MYTLLEVYHSKSSASLLSTAKPGQGGKMMFDKDDEIAMRFVTAAANLRMMAFQIDPQSFYHIKGIAGNIVPAIATTNAIISGMYIFAHKLLAYRNTILKFISYII